MNETSATDRPVMAKTQKTFYLNDDLAVLIEAYQQKSGSSFTRVVTAALLGHLFDGLDQPDYRNPVGPRPIWISAAWRLERGDVKADDMVWWLIQEFVDQGHRRIIHRDKDDEGRPTKPDPALVEQVGAAETLRAMFDNYVRSHSGDRHAAMMDLVENIFALDGFIR